MLVGTDIEMIGVSEYDYNMPYAWEQWLTLLETLPAKGDRLGIGGGVWAHRDGISAEFGFDPVDNLDEFMSRLHQGKHALTSYLENPVYAVDQFPIDTAMLVEGIGPHLEMGCAPDNVVTGNGRVLTRRVPQQVIDLPIRECSGHIHISLPEPYLTAPEMMASFITELDAVVWPMVQSEGSPTWYRKRRVFRYTPYGVEYRSLGAGTLYGLHGETIMNLVFAMVRNVWGAS
jgi:hypothetical protein